MNEDAIVKTFRAGATKKDDEGNIKPRPLVVCFKNESTAEMWHNGGRGLLFKCEDKDVEETAPRQFWINQDLCRADREARFFARQERRKRREAWENQRADRTNAKTKNSER